MKTKKILIVVDAACCAGVTPASHDTALAAMKVIQVEVLNRGLLLFLQ